MNSAPAEYFKSIDTSRSPVVGAARSIEHKSPRCIFSGLRHSRYEDFPRSVMLRAGTELSTASPLATCGQAPLTKRVMRSQPLVATCLALNANLERAVVRPGTINVGSNFYTGSVVDEEARKVDSGRFSTPLA